MSENLEKLFKLIKENPTLPILPMVDSEIVCDDDCSRWTGSWGCATKDKYIILETRWSDAGRVFFYDENDMEDAMESAFTDKELDMFSDEEYLQKYRSLPWIEALVVNIDLP